MFHAQQMQCLHWKITTTTKTIILMTITIRQCLPLTTSCHFFSSSFSLRRMSFEMNVEIGDSSCSASKSESSTWNCSLVLMSGNLANTRRYLTTTTTIYVQQQQLLIQLLPLLLLANNSEEVGWDKLTSQQQAESATSTLLHRAHCSHHIRKWQFRNISITTSQHTMLNNIKLKPHQYAQEAQLVTTHSIPHKKVLMLLQRTKQKKNSMQKASYVKWSDSPRKRSKFITKRTSGTRYLRHLDISLVKPALLVKMLTVWH